ncbi:MAG: hypothetical protein KAG97_10375 [Victivallales bacterium]|nr:hypothetical protein [Victivallales bacterium]
MVCDGARPGRPEEAELVAASRAVLHKVDWPCEVLTHYSETNLGCRRRVATGLRWIFQTVEEAIVLEDDCLPDLSFFPFCEQLLDRYRGDKRIAAISGDNFQNGRSRTTHSYYFSKYFHCWGWASWRRVWETFDADMKSWSSFRKSRGLRKWCDAAGEEAYWERIFGDTHDGKIDSWAFSWLYSCWRHDGLTILPDVNLVRNIGFGSDATHTRQGEHLFANLPTRPICPLNHPSEVSRNIEADRYTFSHNFCADRGWKHMRNQLKWHWSRWQNRAA